jgi:DNA-binding transcriptional regulator GbsR (MarR family)
MSEVLTDRQIATRDKWEEHERKIRDLLHLNPDGMTRAEIMESTGLYRALMAKAIDRLRRNGLVYVLRYGRKEGKRGQIEVFALGANADAKRVSIRLSTHEYKKLREEAKVEKEIEDTRDRHHAEWKRTWQPHPDPAAAWFMTPQQNVGATA